MQIRRAKEIVTSPESIEVIYKGKPVWIESINNQTNSAYVKYLDNSERMEVPVMELVENEKH
ncbi:H-type small acid-soluble spore protein [Alkalithermobacter paradoxus]|uniref:Small, acid-soluble spore protein H n=1 Tax=Alkalithermobacter paradoxus TaxID=29349 RepID=A0A1V4I580_9FIRM|nr:small, acid-soluble spore protein H [[Clostridium] thermoalcaliphilum]